MTAPAVGTVVTGRCCCHTGGTVTGPVERVELVRMAGRPVRLLLVRGHQVPVGNLVVAK